MSLFSSIIESVQRKTLLRPKTSYRKYFESFRSVVPKELRMEPNVPAPLGNAEARESRECVVETNVDREPYADQIWRAFHERLCADESFAGIDLEPLHSRALSLDLVEKITSQIVGVEA